VLGALINEVPAEMRESDDRVARLHEKTLLRGEWNSGFRIRVGASLWQSFLSRSSPAAPASSSELVVLNEVRMPIVFSAGQFVRFCLDLQGRVPLKPCESRHRKLNGEPAVC
jgi:hypothetical protein